MQYADSRETLRVRHRNIDFIGHGHPITIGIGLQRRHLSGHCHALVLAQGSNCTSHAHPRQCPSTNVSNDGKRIVIALARISTARNPASTRRRCRLPRRTALPERRETSSLSPHPRGAQGLFLRRDYMDLPISKTLRSTRPPGTGARYIRSAAGLSGKNWRPCWHKMTSNEAWKVHSHAFSSTT